MKKLLLIIVLCLSLLLLPACGKKEPVYEVEYDGRTYVVDTVNQTVQDDDFTYSYEISHGGTGITIEYPDGSTSWWQEDGAVSYGGWSNDHDPSKYPTDGTVLIEVLEQEAPKQRSDRNMVPFFLLLIVGLFNLLAPEASWYLSHGWRYKNAEPSDAGLVAARISGGIAIAAAVLMLFV
jgi:predicted small lipoprotein YifL